jgi:hypothetical protein
LGPSIFRSNRISNGRKLITLRDAAEYISELPEAEHALPHWVTAIECLMLVAEHNGPTMFARIAMMQALHRDKPEAAPRRNRSKPSRSFDEHQGYRIWQSDFSISNPA